MMDFARYGRMPTTPRRSLFRKYFFAFFTAVVIPLVVSGGIEAWFGYRDQRAHLNDLLGAEARGAAAKIEGFIGSITDQLGWMVQLPWTPGAEERQRIDALRLLRQVPAIVSLTVADGVGKERLHVSRIGQNRSGSGADLSNDPAVVGARAARVWYGPLTYLRGSEPFMMVAVAGNRAAVGVAVAEINLKLIWEVISAIQVGKTGQAFVLDEPGGLIAHPDISLVLRGANDPAVKPLRDLRDAILAADGEAAIGQDTTGVMVIASIAPVPGVDWTIVVKQPVAEALGPIYAALWRTGSLLVAGSMLAGVLAFWLARHMTEPIRLLEEGTKRIGAGEFDHRIEVATTDELGRLATQFNQMASELKISQERSERISRLKRFLAPQVAELVDRVGDDSVLNSQRLEVVVIFGDLRGFTAFSARAEPDEVMFVLGAYYEALGVVVTKYEATLTNFSGDGVMVLINAPVACPDPAPRAMHMVIEMQDVIQRLVADWRSRGHSIGFGVGVALGQATVGSVGSGSRLDYTAIGSVVNLASRLCAVAGDRQILLDPAAAEAVRDIVPLVTLGPRPLKGFDGRIQVFAVQWPTGEDHGGQSALCH
jgi:adenylate cyclase